MQRRVQGTDLDAEYVSYRYLLVEYSLYLYLQLSRYQYTCINIYAPSILHTPYSILYTLYSSILILYMSNMVDDIYTVTVDAE